MIPNNSSQPLGNSGPAQLQKRKKNKMTCTLTILISTTTQTMKIRKRTTMPLALKMAEGRTPSRLIQALQRIRKSQRGIFRSRSRRSTRKRRKAMTKTSKGYPCLAGGVRTTKRILMKGRKKRTMKRRKRMRKKRIAIQCGAIKLTQGDHSLSRSSQLAEMSLFNSKFLCSYQIGLSSNSKGLPSKHVTIKHHPHSK